MAFMCRGWAFFYNHPAPPEIYTLSLHDALPISFSSAPRSTTACVVDAGEGSCTSTDSARTEPSTDHAVDRKSTRLNSSHVESSYAVFCLKNKFQDRAVTEPLSFRQHRRGS